MPKPAAVAGAMMMCSFGMAPSSLGVVAPRPIVEGRPAAAITDIAPGANIPPFAMCQSLANPDGGGCDGRRARRPDPDAVHPDCGRPVGAGIADDPAGRDPRGHGWEHLHVRLRRGHLDRGSRGPPHPVLIGRIGRPSSVVLGRTEVDHPEMKILLACG